MTSVYEMHKANHNRVAAALSQVERAANVALRANDIPSVEAMTSTQMMLVAIKAEARLQKMIHTPGWLNEGQCEYVSKATSRHNAWQRLIETGFRSRYGKRTRKRPLEELLDHDPAARYITMRRILDKDLKLVFEMRNKLAHGQWAYAFGTGNKVSPDLMQRLKTVNTLALRFQDSIAEDLANATGDLLAPGAGFEKSFNDHLRKIKSSHEELANLDFRAHVVKLQTRRSRPSISTKSE